MMLVDPFRKRVNHTTNIRRGGRLLFLEYVDLVQGYHTGLHVHCTSVVYVSVLDTVTTQDTITHDDGK